MSKGFTLVETIVALTVLLLLSGLVLIIVNPLEIRERLNDSRRMSDLGMLSRAVTAYKIDNKVFPDVAAVSPDLRQSDVLPAGQTHLNQAASGWIVADLSNYLSKLFTDPKNTDDFVYRYAHDDNTFELDCLLEYYIDKMSGDGGNNVNKYEVGTNLTLLN